MLKVLVIGDPYFDTKNFEKVLSNLESKFSFTYFQIPDTKIDLPVTESEKRLREYAGNPKEIAKLAKGFDILVVHGAGISEEVLATPGLRMVCCARGGPVNVDSEAATKLGIPITNSPGKNAAAVADLTIAFSLILLRGIFSSSKDLISGKSTSESVFDGKNYFGVEPKTQTLGLVGFGNVGKEVLARARPLGFEILTYDPFAKEFPSGVESVGLNELLDRSNLVSLHARLTKDNLHFIDQSKFNLMKDGAFFINSAREQLVNESDLLVALNSNKLGGAALDVFELMPNSEVNPLLKSPKVIATPHIGGATTETLVRGAHMVSESIRAFATGKPIPYLTNPDFQKARFK